LSIERGIGSRILDVLPRGLRDTLGLKKGGLAGIRIGSLRRELIVLMRPHELIEIARQGEQ
jgi:hypothetical protein